MTMNRLPSRVEVDAEAYFCPERPLTLGTSESWSSGLKTPDSADQEFETNQFDIFLSYSESDCEMATKFKQYMEKNMTLEDKRPPKICTMDSLKDIQSKFHHIDQAIQRSTFMFLLLTPSFCMDTWADMQKEECLMESIDNKDKRWCVVPVHTEPKKSASYKVPCGLRSLKGIDISKILPMQNGSQNSYSSFEKKFLSDITEILNKNLHLRKERESEERHELKMKKIREDCKSAEKKKKQEEELKKEASKLEEFLKSKQSDRMPSGDSIDNSHMGLSGELAGGQLSAAIEETTHRVEFSERVNLPSGVLYQKLLESSAHAVSQEKHLPLETFDERCNFVMDNKQPVSKGEMFDERHNLIMNNKKAVSKGEKDSCKSSVNRADGLTGEQCKNSDEVKFADRVCLAPESHPEKHLRSQAPEVLKEKHLPTEIPDETFRLLVNDEKVVSQDEKDSQRLCKHDKDDVNNSNVVVSRGLSGIGGDSRGWSSLQGEEKDGDGRKQSLISDNQQDPSNSDGVNSTPTANSNANVIGKCPKKSPIIKSQVDFEKKELNTAHGMPQAVSLPSDVISEVVQAATSSDAVVGSSVADSTTQTSVRSDVKVLHHHHIVREPDPNQENAAINRTTKIYNIRGSKYVQIGEGLVINAAKHSSNAEEQNRPICRDESDGDDDSTHDHQVSDMAKSEVDEESDADETNVKAATISSTNPDQHPEGEEVSTETDVSVETSIFMETNDITIAANKASVTILTDVSTTNVPEPNSNTGFGIHGVEKNVAGSDKQVSELSLKKEHQVKDSVSISQDETIQTVRMTDQTESAEQSTSAVSEIYIDRIPSSQGPTTSAPPCAVPSSCATPLQAVPYSEMLRDTKREGNCRNCDRYNIDDNVVQCCEGQGHHDENEVSRLFGLGAGSRDRAASPPVLNKNTQREEKGKVVAKVSPTMIRRKQGNEGETERKQTYIHTDSRCPQGQAATTLCRPELNLSIPGKINLDQNLSYRHESQNPEELFSRSPPDGAESNVAEHSSSHNDDDDEFCISEENTMDVVAAEFAAAKMTPSPPADDHKESPAKQTNNSETDNAAIKAGSDQDMVNVSLRETRNEDAVNVSAGETQGAESVANISGEPRGVEQSRSNDSDAVTHTVAVDFCQDAIQWQESQDEKEEEKNKKRCIIS